MLWIEADLLDICSTKKLLNLRNDIASFALANGDRKLALESIRFWDEEHRILLPFRTGSVSIDLTFLFGVVKEYSINVTCACKRWSLQKAGYNLLGFRNEEDELVRVAKHDFSGFGSNNWQVLEIGEDGYSVCVHVRGFVSIWRFYTDSDVKREKWYLRKRMVFSSKDIRFLNDVGRLRLVLKNNQMVPPNDIELLAKSIYDDFRDIQHVLTSSDLAADQSRNVAP